MALAGLALALAGLLGVWIPHRTAALTVTGFELSEWAKFFPEVQSGAVPIRRELFVLPLVVVAVELALLAQWGTRRLWLCTLGTALGMALALAALPPLQLLRDPAYRPRLILSLAGALAALASPLARLLPRRLVAALAALLALAGGALPVWQFTQLHPLFAALYAAPLSVGWGAFLCPAGFLLVALAAVRHAFRAGLEPRR